MTGSLRGQVAVVTGGNRGIGLGLATGLARAGADICIWARDEAASAKAVEELSAHGTTVCALRCDVADETEVVDAFGRTIERLGKVDSFIANAGTALGLRPFVDIDLDLWRRTMAVNLEGAVAGLREAARHMVERGEGGALVVVSSVAALHGAPRNQAYSASKAGLLALSRGLAVELAPHHIRCNALVVGWMDTDLLADVKENDRWRDAVIGRVPIRRLGDPRELESLAVFVASREPLFHTGDEIVVDGGYTKF